MDWTTYVLFAAAFGVVAYYQFIKPNRSKEKSMPRGVIKGSEADRESSNKERTAAALNVPPTPKLDLQQIKAHMVQFAQCGKTMEFLAESLKVRGSGIGEIAAEVLASQPEFAEILAEELATFYTYVKEQLGQGNDIAGEVRAKQLMKPDEVMDMGRAAHLLMRAMRYDPNLANRTKVVNSLRRVEHSSDSFVSGNAIEALRIVRNAN